MVTFREILYCLPLFYNGSMRLEFRIAFDYIELFPKTIKKHRIICVYVWNTRRKVFKTCVESTNKLTTQRIDVDHDIVPQSTQVYLVRIVCVACSIRLKRKIYRSRISMRVYGNTRWIFRNWPCDIVMRAFRV